ncbi:MAG: hypothetical protein EHM12_05895 [Dehalococcoidia bacterium]|nr:MAG: hypothetical protein EHM12_05895 [Dehalococcoidia bacterium]
MWYCSELCWASYWNEGKGINIESNTKDPNSPEGTIQPNPATKTILEFIINTFSLNWDISTLPFFQPCFNDPVFPHEIESRLTPIGDGHGIDKDHPIVENSKDIIVLSPIDISVTTPDGYTISKDTCNLSGAFYIEDDLDGDGDLEAVIHIPSGPKGTYHIAVTPHSGVSPNETYSIIFYNDGNETAIPVAVNTLISAIPPQGYNVHYNGTNLYMGNLSASVSTRLGDVHFTTNNGTMSELTNMPPGKIPCPSGDYTFPYGMFSYKITNLTPGQTARITMAYHNPIPMNNKYFKCQNNHLTDCSDAMTRPDRYTVALTVTDGGTGDSDGQVNGTIVDPGGPAIQTYFPATPSSGNMPASNQSPVISIQSTSLSASQVTPGTPVTVTAIISNNGTAGDSSSVKLYINGEMDSSQEITTASGGSQQVHFTVKRSQPGTYTVSIDNVQAGSFTVEEPFNPTTIFIVIGALIVFAILFRIMYLVRQEKYYH